MVVRLNEKCVEFEGFKDLIRLTKQDQWFCSKKKITHRKSRLQNTRSSFVTANVFFLIDQHSPIIQQALCQCHFYVSASM